MSKELGAGVGCGVRGRMGAALSVLLLLVLPIEQEGIEADDDWIERRRGREDGENLEW